LLAGVGVSIATTTPPLRGLKHLLPSRKHRDKVIATTTPPLRGLKQFYHFVAGNLVDCIATTTPPLRGLKHG